MEQLDMESLSAYRETLLRRIAELQVQMEPLARQLNEARVQMQAIETLLSAGDPGFAASRNEAAHGRSGDLAEDNVADAAFSTLQAIGKPMHYRALYEAMLDRGARVRGKDPAANVIAHINVDPRFERVSRGTYGLKEWDDNV